MTVHQLFIEHWIHVVAQGNWQSLKQRMVGVGSLYRSITYKTEECLSVDDEHYRIGERLIIYAHTKSHPIILPSFSTSFLGCHSFTSFWTLIPVPFNDVTDVCIGGYICDGTIAATQCLKLLLERRERRLVSSELHVRIYNERRTSLLLQPENATCLRAVPMSVVHVLKCCGIELV